MPTLLMIPTIDSTEDSFAGRGRHGSSAGPASRSREDLRSELTLGLLHQLSNVLTGIYFNIDVFQEWIEPDHPANSAMGEISDSAQKIQRLLERMTEINLNVSKSEVSYHNLGDLVSNQLDLIRILLPKTVHLEVKHPSEPLYVHVAEPEFRVALLAVAKFFQHGLAVENTTVNIAVGSAAELDPGEPPPAGRVLEPQAAISFSTIHSRFTPDEFEKETGKAPEIRQLAAEIGGQVFLRLPPGTPGVHLLLLLPQVDLGH